MLRMKGEVLVRGGRNRQVYNLPPGRLWSTLKPVGGGGGGLVWMEAFQSFPSLELVMIPQHVFPFSCVESFTFPGIDTW